MEPSVIPSALFGPPPFPGDLPGDRPGDFEGDSISAGAACSSAHVKLVYRFAASVFNFLNIVDEGGLREGAYGTVDIEVVLF